MARVSDVQATLHGGDAEGAGGGVAVAGRRSGGGECRTDCSGELSGDVPLASRDAVEAEPMFRRLHEVTMRVLGAEDPNTLVAAGNLATSLSHQGKHADAERIERGVLGAKQRVTGPSIQKH